MLRSAASVAAEASFRRVEAARVLDERAARSTTRREFFTHLSLAAAATVATPTLLGAKSGSTARVVIVGAGLAGLTCAYRLKQDRKSTRLNSSHRT